MTSCSYSRCFLFVITMLKITATSTTPAWRSSSSDAHAVSMKTIIAHWRKPSSVAVPRLLGSERFVLLKLKISTATSDKTSSATINCRTTERTLAKLVSAELPMSYQLTVLRALPWCLILRWLDDVEELRCSAPLDSSLKKRKLTMLMQQSASANTMLMRKSSWVLRCHIYLQLDIQE